MKPGTELFCHCCERKDIALGKYRVILKHYDITKDHEKDEIGSQLFCEDCINDIKTKSKKKEIHTVKAKFGFKGYIFIKDVDPDFYKSLNIYAKPKDKSEDDIICEDLDFLF